jgi:lysophospholipase L1-like esterase
MIHFEFVKTVLCYGDSLSWGIVPGTRNRHAYGKRWTGRLQAALWPKVRIVEDCLNGRTTVWEDPFRPQRNGKAWMLPVLEAHAPLDLVILFLGTNDLLSIHKMGALQAAQGVGALIDVIQESRVEGHYPPPRILVLSPPLISPRGDMVHKFDNAEPASREFLRWYARVAGEKSCLFFDTAACIEASAVDGVHLDEAAHKLLADTLTPVVLQALGL